MMQPASRFEYHPLHQRAGSCDIGIQARLAGWCRGRTLPSPPRGPGPWTPMPHARRSTALAAGIGRCLALPAVLAGVLLAWAPHVHAQTYFVDNQNPAATDTGPGTEEVPYRTILAAITAHRGPGITILVNPGIYREQLSV